MRIPLLALLLFCCLLSSIPEFAGGLRQAVANPRLGDPAPVLDLPALDGGMVKLGPRSGQILVVDFFATWCGPCREAMAALDGLLPQLGPRVTLLVVDVREPLATVRGFFASHPLPAGVRVVLDVDGQAARLWGQDRFPTTFLVDEQGTIRHINRGYGPGYGARVLSWLRAMLK